MRLADEKALRIDDVAERWTKEPGAADASTIRGRLWVAYCKGEFQDGRVSGFGVLIPPGQKYSGFRPQPYRLLLRNMLPPRVDGARSLSKEDLKRAANLPWDDKSKIRNRISPDCIFHFEHAAITRQALLAWCRRKGHKPPMFWDRDAQATTSAENQQGDGQTQPGAVARMRRRPGRAKGVGSYEKADQPLLEKMGELIRAGTCTSPSAAARMVAERAIGKNTSLESKVRRLVGRFNKMPSD